MERRQFFVSRSGADVQKTLWLCSVLSKLGYSYHEQGQWPAGTNFVRAMGDAIDASDHTLALFSPRYFAKDSRYTEQEWTAALVRASLIGVLIEPCRVHSSLTPFTYIDLTRDSLAQQERTLAGELEKLTYTSPPSKPPWVSPRAPTRIAAQDVQSLPQICDREDEETSVQRRVRERGPGQTVLVIVPGCEDELPERFAERVQSVSILELLAAKEEPNVRPLVVLPWPAARTVDDIQMKLELARDNNYLAGFAPEDAIVISTQLDAEDQSDRDIHSLLEAYVRFWLDLAAGQACVIVICLAVRYPSPGLFDFRRRRAIKTLREAIDALAASGLGERCLILPSLDSVPRSQVRKWAELTRVKTVAEIPLDQVDALYEGGIDKIPLGKLAPQLTTLIERNARRA